MTDEKIRENGLRRLADQQGLRLVKSHGRDPSDLDSGGYTLVNIATNDVVAGTEAIGDRQGERLHPHWSLDDIEAYLTGAGARDFLP